MLPRARQGATVMRRSPLVPIFLIVLVDILAMTILIPLLPFYAEHYGARPIVYGLLVSSFAACQLISGPILGSLSDRFGRRPLLLLSQLGTFAGLILLANSRVLILIFAARILDGITAGNLSIAQAYVSDVTTKENRAKGFALIGVAFGFGFVVGPGITALLAPYGYAVPIYGAAAMSALSIVATFFLLPSDPPRSDGPLPTTDEPPPRRLSVFHWAGYLAYFRRPVLGRLLIQFFLFSLAFALFTSGFALFAERRFTWDGHRFGPREIGTVFIFVGLLGMVIQGGLLGRMVKRFGERRLVICGFLLAAVGYAGLGLAFGLVALAVVGGLCSIGNGILRPSLTSEITHVAARNEQGVILGLTQSLFSLAAIVAPLVGNGLIDAGHSTAWAWSAGVVSLVGFGFAIRSLGSTGPETLEPVPPVGGAAV